MTWGPSGWPREPGQWILAIVATAIVVATLGPARFLERRMFGRSRSRLPGPGSPPTDLQAMGRLMHAMDEGRDHFREVGSTRTDDGLHRSTSKIRARTGADAAAFLAELDALEGVNVAATGPTED